jgi:hypothetical protein
VAARCLEPFKLSRSYTLCLNFVGVIIGIRIRSRHFVANILNVESMGYMKGSNTDLWIWKMEKEKMTMEGIPFALLTKLQYDIRMDLVHLRNAK